LEYRKLRSDRFLNDSSNRNGTMNSKFSTAAIGLTLALAFMFAAPSRAATVDVTVGAFLNSSSGGIAATTPLAAGETFTVTAGLNDLWNAGDLPRWSNADGLVAVRFATGTDESGQSAGTQIGQIFPLWTQNGLTAPFGALVGEIGLGPFFLIGTNFTGFSASNDTLKLFYWDSNFQDNSGSITAFVTAVPELSTWVMFLIGFACVGFLSYKRRPSLRIA
jgi:hypothetical protein